MTVLYFLLNGLFHLFHIAIIVFVMIGWMFPSLRAAHLVLMLLMLGSWFVLGRWLGPGYCPVSDWHWRAKAAFGKGRPNGTYIHLLLQHLSGRTLDSSAVDKVVVLSTLALTGMSLATNFLTLGGLFSY